MATLYGERGLEGEHRKRKFEGEPLLLIYVVTVFRGTGRVFRNGQSERRIRPEACPRKNTRGGLGGEEKEATQNHEKEPVRGRKRKAFYPK